MPLQQSAPVVHDWPPPLHVAKSAGHPVRPQKFPLNCTPDLAGTQMVALLPALPAGLRSRLPEIGAGSDAKHLPIEVLHWNPDPQSELVVLHPHMPVTLSLSVPDGKLQVPVPIPVQSAFEPQERAPPVEPSQTS